MARPCKESIASTNRGQEFLQLLAANKSLNWKTWEHHQLTLGHYSRVRSCQTTSQARRPSEISEPASDLNTRALRSRVRSCQTTSQARRPSEISEASASDLNTRALRKRESTWCPLPESIFPWSQHRLRCRPRSAIISPRGQRSRICEVMVIPWPSSAYQILLAHQPLPWWLVACLACPSGAQLVSRWGHIANPQWGSWSAQQCGASMMVPAKWSVLVPKKTIEKQDPLLKELLFKRVVVLSFWGYNLSDLMQVA